MTSLRAATLTLALALVGCNRAPAPAAGGATGDSAKLIEAAQDEYVHGHYDSALANARRGLAVAPAPAQSLRAWRVIGASSCFLKDRSGALEASQRLDGQDRQFVSYVCQRNGVDITSPPSTPPTK